MLCTLRHAALERWHAVPARTRRPLPPSLALDPPALPLQWGRWPPVAFVRMARDVPTNDRITRNQKVFEDAGVPAQIIEVRRRLRRLL